MDPATVLEELLGAPVVNYWAWQKSAEDLFKEVQTALTRKQVVLLTAGAECSLEKNGFAAHFPYPVVRAYNHEGINLLKLKNVYGRYSQPAEEVLGTGEKNPLSSTISQFLKRSQLSRERDEGFFFVQERDIPRYFSYLTASLHQKHYVYNHLELQCQVQRAVYVSFRVDEAQRVCVRLHQKCLRFDSQQAEENHNKNGEEGEETQRGTAKTAATSEALLSAQNLFRYYRVDFRLIREENNGFVEGQAHNYDACWRGQHSIRASGKHVYLTLEPAIYYARIKFYTRNTAAAAAAATKQSSELIIPTLLSTYSEKFIKLRLEESLQSKFVFRQYLKSRVVNKEFKEQWKGLAFVNQDSDDSWRQVIGVWNQATFPLRATIKLTRNDNAYFRSTKHKRQLTLELQPNKKDIAIVKFLDLDALQEVAWSIDFEQLVTPPGDKNLATPTN